MKHTPPFITSLKEDEVFVFGSNEAGRHGAGAARMALQFGAVYGQKEGIAGQTYAIPTKDATVRKTLSVDEIRPYVDRFIAYAKEHSDKTFLVTEIGCGLAGLTPAQVAPLFSEAKGVSNIILPESF
jgi:hypothetical protein